MSKLINKYTDNFNEYLHDLVDNKDGILDAKKLIYYLF
jgi:hypothetical protein